MSNDMKNTFNGAVALSQEAFNKLVDEGILLGEGVSLTYDPTTTLYLIPEPAADATLSDESENPIQNKVVKQSIDGISASIAALQSSLEDLSKEIPAELDSKISELQDDLDDLETKITNLDSIVTEAVQKSSPQVLDFTNF